jgi:hypothetical protein
MKKHILMNLIPICALLFMSQGIYAMNSDTLELRKPISIVDLPEVVVESIQEDYADYRITDAVMVTKGDAELNGQSEGVTHGPPAEGTGKSEHEGAQHDKGRERAEHLQQESQDQDTYYDIKIEGPDVKIVRYSEDGEELEFDEDEDVHDLMQLRR